MRYITKTKIIRAFQLTSEMAVPDWAAPYFSGQVDGALLLSSGHKVFISDWFIEHHSGVWVLTDAEFQREYAEW